MRHPESQRTPWRVLPREEKQRRLAAMRRKQQIQVAAEMRRLLVLG